MQKQILNKQIRSELSYSVSIQKTFISSKNLFFYYKWRKTNLFREELISFSVFNIQQYITFPLALYLMNNEQITKIYSHTSEACFILLKSSPTVIGINES